MLEIEGNMFGWFKKKSKTKLAEPFSLQDSLYGLVEAHGLKAEKFHDWVLVNNKLPGLRGNFIPPGSSSGNKAYAVSFELRLSPEQAIIETYAAAGADERSAVGQGLFKFCAGAFHVFLSAFWEHHEPDQVEIEQWIFNRTSWNVYLSNLINNVSDGQKAGLAPDYMKTVQAIVQTLSLDDQIHWISVFFCNFKGELTCETLLDNALWPELSQALLKLEWPVAEGYYSQRQFILLRPRA
jgi:hypothetical protein